MDDARRAELVEKRDALRRTRLLCEHGVTAPDPDDDRGCAGAIGRCRCCSQYFCYADGGSSDGVTEWIRTWTKDLCRECGGYSIETTRPARY